MSIISLTWFLNVKEIIHNDPNNPEANKVEIQIEVFLFFFVMQLWRVYLYVVSLVRTTYLSTEIFFEVPLEVYKWHASHKKEKKKRIPAFGCIHVLVFVHLSL